MYKITKSNLQSIVDAYEQMYSPKALEIKKEYYNGKTFKKEVDKDNKITAEIGASNGSFAYTFLEDCILHPDKLKRLLVGNYADHLSIISEVRSNSEDNLKRLTKEKYPQIGFAPKGSTIRIDDFNELMKEIFINRMFDADDNDDNHLRKTEFIQSLNLKYCPYCAESLILPIEKDTKKGVTYVKPQLDHFLPKHRYPFLAMNFYNLIPSCTNCNMSPNKGMNDPIGEDGKHQKIMHPYHFDTNAFSFDYEPDPLDLFDEEKFKVLIDYKGNTDLAEGFTKIIYIENLYKIKNDEACDMYTTLHTDCEALKEQYEDLGVRGSEWKKINPRGYFHHDMDDSRAMLVRNYKFNIDLYNKMYAYFEKELKK